jgi:hypothetical protein
LEALGDRNRHLALTHRYRTAMQGPINLGDDDAQVERRSALMLAMNDLMQYVHREFLRETTRSQPPKRTGC